MMTITTSRLTLRPPQDSDVAALVTALNNFAVSRWTGRIPHPYGPQDAETFLAHARSAPNGALILLIDRGGVPIGGIGIEHGELGYWLAEPQWGQGYGTEAARAVIDHAFGIIGFDRVTASHHFGNEASRRILRGLGFMETGEARGFSRARQQEVAFATLELTRDGWKTARERRR